MVDIQLATLQLTKYPHFLQQCLLKVISGPQVKQSGSTKPLFQCGSCTSVLLSWQFFPLKKVKAKHPIEDLGKGRNCKSDVGTGSMNLVINPDVNDIAAIAIMSHLIMTISVSLMYM